MKNLIILICAAFLLGGCDDRPSGTPIQVNPIVITSISETTVDGICKYKIDNKNLHLSGNLEWFKDTCGKYSVGDTLTFIKINHVR